MLIENFFRQKYENMMTKYTGNRISVLKAERSGFVKKKYRKLLFNQTKDIQQTTQTVNKLDLLSLAAM